VDLRALPKLELHNHLDCGLRYDAVRRIDPAISRETYDRAFVAPPKCASLADYLRYTLNHRAVLQTERALRIAVADAFSQLAEDGVVYAELRFAPLVHVERGLSADAVVRSVSEETVRQSEMTGIDAVLILCTLRNFDSADSLETARLVERHARSGPVVALDIAGDEAASPLDPHVPAFEFVSAAGLGVTVHAGEAAGAESVWEALDKTATRRIGHGVRSIEDAALLARLEREQIHLEVCPTCNVQTDVVGTLPRHPVDRLHRSGVRVGISTDTRAVTDVRLTQEYERLRDVFGWTLADFEQVNRNALDAAFAAEPVRRRIADALDQGFAEVSA
jgi:adenosine deaminase